MSPQAENIAKDVSVLHTQSKPNLKDVSVLHTQSKPNLKDPVQSSSPFY